MYKCVKPKKETVRSCSRNTLRLEGTCWGERRVLCVVHSALTVKYRNASLGVFHSDNQVGFSFFATGNVKVKCLCLLVKTPLVNIFGDGGITPRIFKIGTGLK